MAKKTHGGDRGPGQPRIVIVGAGPTGLGAGYRLQELGYDDWVVLEGSERVGGLATSFQDDAGFTYDIGGHVMFSHYSYWDDVVDKLLGDDYTELTREAWVWTEGRFVPYPFQNNIRDLSPQTIFECLDGLIQAQSVNRSPATFREWIDATFGPGIARHFMVPYNFKVWATPAELMNHVWIGERVSVVGVTSILRNVVLGEDQVSWGPNNTFRYPRQGGTGHLWDRLSQFLGDKLHLGTPVCAVDTEAKRVTTADGRSWPYDVLLSTMPLNHLVQLTPNAPDAVRRAAGDLCWSGSHIVGVGLDRPAETTKNWIYYPEPDLPFYRVTYLSNYSPHMCPRPDQTLLLTETSRSEHKVEDAATIVGRVIDGLVTAGLMTEDDRGSVVTTWLCSPEMSYPVPSLGRDAALGTIQPWLREQSVWSRGRFGAWLYEVGNMDHSVMQGVEFVNQVLFSEPETVWIPRGEASGPDGGAA